MGENQKAVGKGTQANEIKDGLIFYMPKGYICHLTIDTARVKMATRDQRKITKTGGIWKYNLPYMKNYTTKCRGYLVSVQVKNMG